MRLQGAENVFGVWFEEGCYDEWTKDIHLQVENEWDFDAIKKLVDEQESFRESDYDDLRKEVFIGTVMSVTPSGKFYMPWACNNVSIKEAIRDEVYLEYFQKLLEKHDLYLTSGEGDPCDLLVGMILVDDENEEED